MKRPLALTCGDPAGIGTEIAIKAWSNRAKYNLPPFFLLTDPDHLASAVGDNGPAVAFQALDPEDAISVFADALPVVALENRFSARAGEPSSAYAAGILESIERAVALALGGEVAAVVTCPIAKSVLYDAGFKFPGHTEFLAHLCEQHSGVADKPVMMLVGPELRSVPVTIHIPLAEVPRKLTTDAIVETSKIVARDLQNRFGIARPRLAVSGLNPHAGENGALGSEDASVVAPAIDMLRRQGIDARGPLPADTMFHKAARDSYDAAICMYHDQALIPAKALAFDEAVNVTLGLPIIRTSPDHGTAFDIAGKGVAREDSLMAALKLAAEMAGLQSNGN